MGRIQQLSVDVVNKIAAGEVIERPASVVKELLENSVDAGATRIDIDVEQGGIELIRIVDNGHGIVPEDLPLAFRNHATSKLASADDLFQIHTMGFRGEALASIGGIGQVKIQSRAPDQEMGAEIACHGSELAEIRAWNGAVGTRLEVRHLFYNTPVRRKFLRSASTEMGHVCEIVTRLALARPGLHLTLTHNGKKVYEVPAAASLLDRIGLFFGQEVREALYPVDASAGPVHLFGYVGDPSCDRGNSKLQYLFLNGRWIRDRSLGHALQEAYRGLLMTGRYAVAFLFLEMPPDAVDVNVHPTKAEVRFRDAGTLYSFLLASIKRRLSEANLVPKLQAPSGGFQAAGPSSTDFFQPRNVHEAPNLFSQTGFPTFTKVPVTNRVASPSPRAGVDEPPDVGSTKERSTPEMNAGAHIPAPAEPATPVPPGPTPEELLVSGSEPTRALQVHNQYLVLETADGMLVVDQHALHERILFEQIRERVSAGSLEVQPLLIPEPVDLTAEQASRLLELRDELLSLGLGIEDFGGGTVLVTKYPALMGRRNPGEILKLIVDHLAVQDRLPTREQLLHDLMSLMACHSAVRSGDPLSQEEIAALLEMRHLASDPHHCPHGRPTALLFTRRDLDRQFGRI